MKRFILIAGISLCLVASIGVYEAPDQIPKRKRPMKAEAGKSLADWHKQRAYPGSRIDMTFYSAAFQKMAQESALRMAFSSSVWEPIGPMNFGGRTLDICFNPLNNNTIYAGSASGGLWRTFTAGTGAQAWNQVATGFPVLGVAAIAINPVDSNEIYIGTGEVYNDQNTGTGFAVRTTRGTYGIGILKSTDGGANWSKSLDWQYDELRGVQDLLINPQRPATVFAATTEGTYRSYDSGGTWTLIHPVRMATDMLLMPNDTSVLFVAAGNSFSANPGIYRSTDGGSTFSQITAGLPSSWSGKAMIDVCMMSPQVLYASIAEQLSGLGLYRSDNGGLSWYQATSEDFQTYQGWYSHDVAIRPDNADEVMAGGINTWKSDDGGVTLIEKAFWNNWDFSLTTPGGSEGPPDYVHADVHRIYYHPNNPDIIYLATDGGVFRSLDGGESFEGCNGGYHTQQFYANFSCSATDSLFAIGGMQDNATAVYEGNPGWRRVIGGDGLSTAIHPTNDQVVYGSSQYLNINKSIDKAQNFNWLSVPGSGSSPNTCFAGPFILCPSNPNILYAGRTVVYKSTDAGDTWNPTNGNNMLDTNPVLVLACDPNNAATVYAATAPVVVSQPGLFKTTNGGTSWTNVTAGIPNRYIMDVTVHPSNANIVFTAVSGFGTPHVYRSGNAGGTWSAFGTGIPDVPVNAIVFDPLNPLVMYLGCDIGVFYSIDGGQTWNPFNDGLTDGTLVMDISISPSNRKLRLATHGKGVYERDMLPVTITSLNQHKSMTEVTLFPNPSTGIVNLDCTSCGIQTIYKVIDTSGKPVLEGYVQTQEKRLDISMLDPGLYFLKITSDELTQTIRIVKI